MKATVYTVLSVPDNSKFQSQGTNEPFKQVLSFSSLLILGQEASFQRGGPQGLNDIQNCGTLQKLSHQWHGTPIFVLIFVFAVLSPR